MDGMPWRLPEQAAVQDALRRRMPSGVQDTLWRPEMPPELVEALQRRRAGDVEAGPRRRVDEMDGRMRRRVDDVEGGPRRPVRGEPGGSFERFRDIIMQQRQQPRPRQMPDEGRLADVAGRLRERR